MKRRLDPLEMFIISSIVAILVMIAIPAFMKYMRLAKTAEAIDTIDKIYKGAALYYTTPRVSYTGVDLPCQFPTNQGPTPTVATCCQEFGGPDADGDGRCDFDPHLWSEPTWSSLNFRIARDSAYEYYPPGSKREGVADGQHYFVYTFDAAGVLTEAQFTASAFGDLDCDGVQSTFQRMAFGDARYKDDCSVMGSAAFYVAKETE